MAENIEEKNEAELLEEAMQNLNIDSDNESNEEGQELSDEDIASLLDEDKKEELIEETIEETQVEEDSEVSENEPQEEITEVEDINLNNSQEATPVEDNIEIKDDTGTQKKQSKVFKILIVVAATLLTLVSAGAVLYFVGFFDPEPVKVEVEEIAPAKEEYKFDEKDIDEKRLNKKLNLLTKYEIVENADTEAAKASEKEKLYLEAKKQLEAERQAQIERIKEAERKRIESELPPVKKDENVDEIIEKEIEQVIDKDENINTDVNENIAETEKEEMKENEENNDSQATTENQTTSNSIDKGQEETLNTTQETNIEESSETKDQTVSKVEEEIENTTISEKPKEEVIQNPLFVKVLKISINSDVIYKKQLDEIYAISNDVNLCRDYQNNIEVFIGPFDDDMRREEIAKSYKDRFNIITEITDYTKEEYNNRCNY